MFVWKLLAVSGVVAFAGLSYAVYETFLQTSSSEEAAIGRAATATAKPERTPRPTTPPTPSATATPGPTPGDPVLVGAGDITSCTQENDDDTAALLDSVVSSATGEVVVFTSGDNAYEYGTIEEYEQCYEPTWGRHKARTRPAPGNHEYARGNADGYFAYFGATAGDPSQGYYSYDLGSWHIIVLNTSNHCRIIGCDRGSAQETWLRADLAAHSNLCALAILHDPLFSSGRVHGGADYIQPFWDALYQFGADVIVNGHEHNYERFAPQNPSGERDSDFGIREFVVGTGGESHYSRGDSLPNSEAGNGKTYGVLKLTLHPNSYSWEFMPVSGDFRDSGDESCHGAHSGG
jgi:hypothetical protein